MHLALLNATVKNIIPPSSTSSSSHKSKPSVLGLGHRPEARSVDVAEADLLEGSALGEGNHQAAAALVAHVLWNRARLLYFGLWYFTKVLYSYQGP